MQTQIKLSIKWLVFTVAACGVVVCRATSGWDTEGAEEKKETVVN